MKTYFNAFFLLLLTISCAPEEELFIGSLTTRVQPENSGTIGRISKSNSNVVQLFAVPAEFYLFKGWKPEKVSDPLITENNIFVVLDANKDVTALFELKDTDGDGVTDDRDLCPNTLSGENVDGSGCSDSQKDTDLDGVMDDRDECPYTPSGEPVNSIGCSNSQKDTDKDGVNDDADICPDTPSNESADLNGCALSQKDTDGDGVTDDIDLCPDSPFLENVNVNGCTIFQIGWTLTVDIQHYIYDISWTIKNSAGEILNMYDGFAGGIYREGTITIEQNVKFLPGDTYTFRIFDSFGDGLRSADGYQFTDEAGNLIISGGGVPPAGFYREEIVVFTVSTTGVISASKTYSNKPAASKSKVRVRKY